MQSAIEAQARLLRALGHPIRLEIVRHLSQQPETCACDFTDFFEVSQPTISEHLRTLRQAGVVITRRRGTQICYSLANQPLGELSDLLNQLVSALDTKVAS
ncbi:MAG TPA: metalloregulator ArsR/SmtB family transcription factor [Candidatus Dormibacteraeota bacterium]|nr:metalloregulator ArsR/SmtB family transcription factor [Candidatus Dormibacteraeota bacterium]